MSAIRVGSFLVNWHRGAVRRSLAPSLSRYAKGWWSFLWVGFELSRANTKKLRH